MEYVRSRQRRKPAQGGKVWPTALGALQSDIAVAADFMRIIALLPDRFGDQGTL
jgi:hypothetical protein